MADQNKPEPPDTSFMTELMEGATQMHELFTSFVNAGFTRKEALWLIGDLLRGTPGK